ncbi:hypothetical protein ElyMa_003589100 [Elysia marginata]|uniref:Uncharacterized protein n=1 Tax=Elysia marginata TaxID=1093978 RepID=A0AAV4EPZ2_9GAST|nr:hypothetical protein ElyMa_003589100 [Elysia marginata]
MIPSVQIGLTKFWDALPEMTKNKLWGQRRGGVNIIGKARETRPGLLDSKLADSRQALSSEKDGTVKGNAQFGEVYGTEGSDK